MGVPGAFCSELRYGRLDAPVTLFHQRSRRMLALQLDETPLLSFALRKSRFSRILVTPEKLHKAIEYSQTPQKGTQ